MTKKHKANLPLIRKTIYASVTKKKLRADEKAALELSVLFVKKIINADLAMPDNKKHRLYISDDKHNAGMLECSPEQARRAKERLSKLGIIFVPEGRKQYKPGTVPLWLLADAYMIKPDTFMERNGVDRVSKYLDKQRVAIAGSFSRKFMTIYNEAYKNVRPAAVALQAETPDVVIDGAVVGKMVWNECVALVEARGEEIASYRRSDAVFYRKTSSSSIEKMLTKGR